MQPRDGTDRGWKFHDQMQPAKIKIYDVGRSENQLVNRYCTIFNAMLPYLL